ncbi:MauE/DoxX family redox-associated membrane protein [Aquirufa regiilacus]
MKTLFQYIKLKLKTFFVPTIIFVDFTIYFFSGVDKSLNFEKFVIQFARSPFAPSFFLKEFSIFIIIIEILLCLMLFIEKLNKSALFGFFILSFLFTAYIFLMLIYSPHLPCSCGGLVDFLSWKQHLFLNLFLTITSFLAFLNIKK